VGLYGLLGQNFISPYEEIAASVQTILSATLDALVFLFGDADAAAGNFSASGDKGPKHDAD